MNDDFDELDRALFALPLEEPPPGLRQSILNATIHAPARAALQPILRPWEASLAGAAVAVAVWLVYALVAYKGFAASFTDATFGILRAFSDPVTLAWLGLGAAIAAWLVFLNLSGLRLSRVRLPIRGARS
jgi:hypothetical protein